MPDVISEWVRCPICGNKMRLQIRRRQREISFEYLTEEKFYLPEKKREIIYLYFFGNYTQQEIGE